MNHRQLKKELFKKDQKLKKAYDDLQQEYAIINTLIDARINQNITQKHLSEITGINQSNISKIEQGVYNPSLNTLKKIADGLGLELELKIRKKESKEYV